MLAMDRRLSGATLSCPRATIQQGVLFFACLPAFEPDARSPHGYIESDSDRHHRRRR